MPRGASGVYTLPIPAFIAGTTILSASVNSNYSDIATALTQSLATTGVSSMTGQIKAFAGNTAAPGMAWASDLDTGIYLSATGVQTFVAGGVDLFDISATGIELLEGEFIDKTGAIVRPLPIGCAIDWPANLAAPNGYILAYGQTELIATYPALAAVYGTTYGGDGITTVGIPDYRGRTGIGRDNMGGVTASRITNAECSIVGTTIGATGGVQSFALLQAQLPNYNLSLASVTCTPSATVTRYPNSEATQFGASTNKVEVAGSSTVTFSIGGTLPSGGSGSTHINVQPSIVVNKIVYTGVFV